MILYYIIFEWFWNVNKKESYLNEKIFLKMYKLKWGFMFWFIKFLFLKFDFKKLIFFYFGEVYF